MKQKLFTIVSIIFFACLTIMPAAISEKDDGTLYKEELLLTTTTDKSKYIVGETVNMELAVEQIYGEETYIFKSSQRFDFEIYYEDELIWRWSDDKFFLAVMGYEYLCKEDPMRIYDASWDSSEVKPGIYSLKGIWTCVDPLEYPYDWTEFELE